MTSVVPITKESPRCSPRLANKPKVQYYTKDELEEQDEISQSIQRVCQKKGVQYTDNLLDEFNKWLPTAPIHLKLLFNSIEIAKEWALFVSSTITTQCRINRFAADTHKAIVDYCKKNNIVYTPLMDEKFAQWKADPNNKSYVYTSTTSTDSIWYEHMPSKCVRSWFSTLKKTVEL
jgi:hypothetical protein